MQNIVIRGIEKQDFRTKEAYKTLRTNLEFAGKNVKVVSFTSCTPNEGKTSVSFQLALSMAEAGKRTILVDADLRKSVLRGRYKVSHEKYGLSHYLSGQVYLEDVCCETNIENFYIVFSGPVPPNPSELLGSENFKEMVAKLRQEFDYVIIDTPPLGSVIDSAVVAREVDGAVIVIESNAISYRFAQNVKEQLSKTGCRILGCVLNKVNMGTKGYYGYYGKYYGRYYGKYYGKYYGNYGSEEGERLTGSEGSRTKGKKGNRPGQKNGSARQVEIEKQGKEEKIEEEIPMIREEAEGRMEEEA